MGFLLLRNVRLILKKKTEKYCIWHSIFSSIQLFKKKFTSRIALNSLKEAFLVTYFKARFARFKGVPC